MGFLPTDPKERMRAMLKLVRGEPAVYKLDGQQVRVVPQKPQTIVVEKRDKKP